MSPRNLEKFIAEKGSIMTAGLTSYRNNASSHMRKAAEQVYGFTGISSSPSAFVDGRYRSPQSVCDQKLTYALCLLQWRKEASG